MIETMQTRQARRKGRPSYFDEIPTKVDDPPAPPPVSEADSVIQYGERCACGKPPTWLHVTNTKPGNGCVIRYCICRGCGRSVPVKCPK